jgi:hypothetical protein
MIFNNSDDPLLVVFRLMNDRTEFRHTTASLRAFGIGASQARASVRNRGRAWRRLPHRFRVWRKIGDCHLVINEISAIYMSVRHEAEPKG